MVVMMLLFENLVIDLRLIIKIIRLIDMKILLNLWNSLNCFLFVGMVLCKLVCDWVNVIRCVVCFLVIIFVVILVCRLFCFMFMVLVFGQCFYGEVVVGVDIDICGNCYGFVCDGFGVVIVVNQGMCGG